MKIWLKLERKKKCVARIIGQNIKEKRKRKPILVFTPLNTTGSNIRGTNAKLSLPRNLTRMHLIMSEYYRTARETDTSLPDDGTTNPIIGLDRVWLQIQKGLFSPLDQLFSPKETPNVTSRDWAKGSIFKY